MIPQVCLCLQAFSACFIIEKIILSYNLEAIILQKVLLGNTGISVSRAGFGVLPMGPSQLALPVDEGAEIIKYALKNGINFLDTAQYYRTYPYIKKALEGENYDDIVICSKSLCDDYDGMMDAILEARIALDRDVIDIFLMHEVRSGQLELRSGAWDALKDAKAKGNDVVIVDTAGRLHVDEDLMDEIYRLKMALNPTEILLVIDAMTGQDALNVATAFNEKLEISGIVMSKLDGDTRGGAALSAKAVTGKPIKFASVGEKLSDLEPFYPDRMASRILGMGDVLSLIEKAQETFEEEEQKAYAGKTFVITGSLNHYENRDALKDEIEAGGGKVAGSVSKKTDYLINNDIGSGSSKNKKAKELGIPIITEDMFIEMFK